MMNATFATVRTVSNDPSGGSQYSSLSSAYAASTAGDTLMLEGTDINYGMSGCGEYFNKSLTIIGIGFNPQKQNPRRARIIQTVCWGEFRFHSSASGSKFYGIEFTSWVRTDGPLNNMVFEDCKFNNGFSFAGNSCSNFAFRNCIFDQDNNINYMQKVAVIHYPIFLFLIAYLMSILRATAIHT